MIKAYILNRNQAETAGKLPAVSGSVREIDPADYPQQGEITVSVMYSGMNYKDGMIVKGLGGLVRTYPHVPGIDFAGVISAADSTAVLKEHGLKEGDQVVLTGWRVGEAYWGGYCRMAKVRASWLVPVSLSAERAAAIGTAGFSAMLAIDRLEAAGIKPDAGPVLVTGASGGVGSVAVMLLAALGFEVTAMSGKDALEPVLRSLGATSVIDRNAFAGLSKPLEKAVFQAAIDTVGGDILGRILPQIKYGGKVAAVGLAAGSGLNTTVLPFLLRGIDLLGVDSVLTPLTWRLRLWRRLTALFDWKRYETLVTISGLEAVDTLAAQILSGRQSGRAVIKIA